MVKLGNSSELEFVYSNSCWMMDSVKLGRLCLRKYMISSVFWGYMKVHARGHEVTYEDGFGRAKWKWKMGSFLAMESTLHLFWAPNLKWAMWVGLKIGCPKFWVVCDHLPRKKVAIRAIPISRVTQAARLGTIPTRQGNKMVTSRTIFISHEIMWKSQNHIETYDFSQEWLFPERNNQLLAGPTSSLLQ